MTTSLHADISLQSCSRSESSLSARKASRQMVNPSNELFYALSLRVRAQDKEVASNGLERMVEN